MIKKNRTVKYQFLYNGRETSGRVTVLWVAI